MQMRRQIEAIFNSTGLLNPYRNTIRTSWSLRPQDAEEELEVLWAIRLLPPEELAQRRLARERSLSAMASRRVLLEERLALVS
jgi:hypothetical protein